MARRRRAKKRHVHPDSKFHHCTVAKFINNLMMCGKKSVAEKIVYDAIGLAAVKLNSDAIEVFEKAIKNAQPMVEVRSMRAGGATYQVPETVVPTRSVTLGIRWMVKAARARKGHSMAEKLGEEFIDACNMRGAAVKKRDDVHKMAEANRAFAHYRTRTK
ncbi:30S ribosomal subunit protein S7 [Alphaproteobacteria bacterium]